LYGNVISCYLLKKKKIVPNIGRIPKQNILFGVIINLYLL